MIVIVWVRVWYGEDGGEGYGEDDGEGDDEGDGPLTHLNVVKSTGAWMMSPLQVFVVWVWV